MPGDPTSRSMALSMRFWSMVFPTQTRQRFRRFRAIFSGRPTTSTSPTTSLVTSTFALVNSAGPRADSLWIASSFSSATRRPSSMMASASLESKKLKLFTRGESSRSAARLSSLVVRRIRMASDWSMTSMKELIGRSFEG